MNVPLFLIAGLLVLLILQAEINHRRVLRNLSMLLVEWAQTSLVVRQVETTVNEIQSDLFEIPDSPAILERADFKRHTEQALHIVRGEN